MSWGVIGPVRVWRFWSRSLLGSGVNSSRKGGVFFPNGYWGVLRCIEVYLTCICQIFKYKTNTWIHVLKTFCIEMYLKYLKKKQIHSNTKFNEYMYSANFQIHNQIHVFAQYMYLSPLMHPRALPSPSTPSVRGGEADEHRKIQFKYFFNTHQMHTEYTH